MLVLSVRYFLTLALGYQFAYQDEFANQSQVVEKALSGYLLKVESKNRFSLPVLVQ